MRPITSGLRSAFRFPNTQERALFWFGGLFPLATCLAQPITTSLSLKHSQAPKAERDTLVLNEIIRQGMSAAIQLTTFLGGAILAAAALKDHKHKTVYQIVVGSLFNFVGYGMVRPWLNTSALGKLRHWGQEPSPVRPQPLQELTPSRIPVAFSSAPHLALKTSTASNPFPNQIQLR